MLWQGIAVLLLITITIGLLQRLRLPALLGYLAAGMVLHELQYDLFSASQSLRFLAELGLVFLLFTLGLEFSLPQLKSLRRYVFMLGPLQLLFTAAIVLLPLHYFNLPLGGAIALAMAFAMSSTALVSRLLSAQRELNTHHGRIAIGLLLFQDLAAIPLLILVPGMGDMAALSLLDAIVMPFLKGISAALFLIVVGRRILPVLFHWVAHTQNEELFVLLCLLVTLVAAGVTQALGLSMALGAFLAGTLLGESQYRLQIDAEIRPFRDVLLGLFFISIGNLLQRSVLFKYGWLILLALPTLLIIKALVIAILCRRLRVRRYEAFISGIVLAQVGEFGLALMALIADNKLLTRDYVSVGLAIGIGSMLWTPLLIRHAGVIADYVLRMHHKHDEEGDTVHQIEAAATPLKDHVIVCGFGRVGQLVLRFTEAEGFDVLALDRDAQRVQEAASAGLSVCYADASRAEVLRAAGIDRARMIVVCVDKIESAQLIVMRARQLNGNLPIMVRTQDDTHSDALRQHGATEIVPEILEGSLMLVSHVLVLLGVPMSKVLGRVQRARRGRYKQLKGFFYGAGADVANAGTRNKQQLHAVTLSNTAAANGKCLADFDLDNLQIEVQSINRGNSEIDHPDENQLLQAGDILVLMGLPADIEAAEARLLSGKLRLSKY